MAGPSALQGRSLEERPAPPNDATPQHRPHDVAITDRELERTASSSGAATTTTPSASEAQPFPSVSERLTVARSAFRIRSQMVAPFGTSPANKSLASVAKLSSAASPAAPRCCGYGRAGSPTSAEPRPSGRASAPAADRFRQPVCRSRRRVRLRPRTPVLRPKSWFTTTRTLRLGPRGSELTRVRRASRPARRHRR